MTLFAIYLSTILLNFTCQQPMDTILYNFSKKSSLKNWQIVNDNVMGGRSDGDFFVNDEGHGVFSGQISLENNGGFASVRYYTTPVTVSDKTSIKIRLKGDGQRYQFRVKKQSSNYWSYITYFETTGDWQTIEITLGSMYPNFRGRRLQAPNFDGKQIAEIGFLFGNKKEEAFQLELDSIALD